MKESYSEAFANTNIIITEFAYYYYKYKEFFLSHNKLYNYIQTKYKLLLVSLVVFKDIKLIIIKSVIKLKKLPEYSFRE